MVDKNDELQPLIPENVPDEQTADLRVDQLFKLGLQVTRDAAKKGVVTLRDIKSLQLLNIAALLRGGGIEEVRQRCTALRLEYGSLRDTVKAEVDQEQKERELEYLRRIQDVERELSKLRKLQDGDKPTKS